MTSTGVPDSQIIGRGSSFGNYPLSILETSDDLHTLYDRYPQLRCQLKLIYDAVTEPLDDQLDDSHERSNRRRGRGGNRGQGRDGRTVAKRSRQKGIKAGIQQLRILRHLNGEDGDGLEEFSKLVASLPENNESRNKAPGV